jgi:hypothetical protein
MDFARMERTWKTDNRALTMTTDKDLKRPPGKTRRTPFTAPIQVCWQIFKPAIYLRKVADAVLKGHL